MSRLIHLYQRLIETRWTIGFIDFSEEILNPHKPIKINWIANNPSESWFADPFILSIDAKKIVLLVEELVYKQRKGRISKVVIDRATNKYIEVIPLIDIPTHLSFPAWFERDGKIYIYPENSQSGKLMCYEYDRETESTRLVSTISDLPLVDAAMCEINGKTYMSATVPPNDNGDTLELFPIVDGQTKGESIKVKFDDKIGRNAGAMFCVDGRKIRPAQQCRASYGEGVVLHELVDEKQLKFKELRRIHSDNPKYNIGLHTFNVYKNQLVVVDARGYRWPWGMAVKKLVKLCK